MPISSGATGRVGTENKTYDSYLKRYLETLPQEKKRHMLSDDGHQSQSYAPGPDGENMDTPSQGLKRETIRQQRRGSSDGDAPGKQSTENTSKKSATCTII